jgi:hypothetical protein
MAMIELEMFPRQLSAAPSFCKCSKLTVKAWIHLAASAVWQELWGISQFSLKK